MLESARRTSFGGVAAQYDGARPTYPTQLVEDVIGLARTGEQPLRAVEVGAGTGKATVLFAARGVRVDAIEPSPGMAALARENCAGYPAVQVIETEFEPWERSGEPYPLLYSAQAWHWIEPDVRYARARAALAPGGLLAVFWNRADWDQNPLFEAIDEVYAQVAPELADDGPMRPHRSGTPRGVIQRWEREIKAADGFDSAEIRRYRWLTEYSSEEYVALLGTHSDHVVLENSRRAALLDGIRAVIETAGGVLPLAYNTGLCLARAIGPDGTV